jgi:hypothetical protein
MRRLLGERFDVLCDAHSGCTEDARRKVRAALRGR